MTVDHRRARIHALRLRSLRQHASPVNIAHHDEAALGDRMADRVASSFGSWRFLGYMTGFIIVWITINIIGIIHGWDPYPFILLNLIFSTQASYAAPIILLSQNRSAERDRLKAEHDYQTNEFALQNTEVLKQLTTEVHTLTSQLHDHILGGSNAVSS